MSVLMLATVERVSNVFPHAQLTFAVAYSGCMSGFIGMPLVRLASKDKTIGRRTEAYPWFPRIGAGRGGLRIRTPADPPNGPLPVLCAGHANGNLSASGRPELCFSPMSHANPYLSPKSRRDCHIRRRSWGWHRLRSV